MKKWNRGHVIGRGSSATVFAATSPSTGEIIAAVKTSDLSNSEPLRREAEILSSLKSPHVVTYLGQETTREQFNLFIEYVPGGTLAAAAARERGLPELEIRAHARKIALGLEYIHSLGLVHCDVKGANILLAEDGPKIADFGTAASVEFLPPRAAAGTPMFMAPEVARGEGNSGAGDVWSFGCTVVEMFGVSPWPVSGAGVLYRIAFSGETPAVPAKISPAGRDFLGKCLRRDPAERWTVGELLGHPFLAESEYSPTSVLDRRSWSFAGEKGAPEVEMSCCSDEGDSAAERIRRLACDCEGDLDGQDWITIRSSSGDDKLVLV